MKQSGRVGGASNSPDLPQFSCAGTGPNFDPAWHSIFHNYGTMYIVTYLVQVQVRYGAYDTV